MGLADSPHLGADRSALRARGGLRGRNFRSRRLPAHPWPRPHRAATALPQEVGTKATNTKEASAKEAKARQPKIRAFFDFETWNWEPPEGQEEIAVHALCCGFAIPQEATEEHPAQVARYFLHNQTRTPQEARRLTEKALGFMWKHDEVEEWWAHFAHQFDTLHLLAGAYRLGWTARASLTSAGPVGVDLKPDGEFRWLKIRDLYRVLDSSLAKIAKAFELGVSKEFVKEDYQADMRDLPLDRLKEGCLRDCTLGLAALAKVEGMLAASGGELRSTFSASALTVLKAHLRAEGTKLPRMRHSRPCIRTRQATGAYCRCYFQANAEAQAAYYGARVEVFEHGPQHPLLRLDIASSYPWSMTQEMPIQWQGHVSGKLARRAFEAKVHGAYEATVRVPRSYLPPLPFRLPAQGGLYFPTGTWRAWFALPELLYAQTLGVDVDVRQAHTYSSGFPFRSYVEEWFDLKRNSTGARREFAKKMLNGSYGKFAEKPDRERLWFVPNPLEAIHLADSEPGLRALDPELDPRILAQSYERYAAHAHYAIGAYVTAHSRIRLHRFALMARGLAYSDTDSLDCEAFEGETGEELGQLKLELSGFHGRYYGPKLYSLHNPDGSYVLDAEGCPKVACKGFLKGSGEAFEAILASAATFQALLASGVPKSLAKEGARGAGQSMVRTRLLRTQLNPKEDHNEVLRRRAYKSWTGLSKKRKPFPDGSTRPWTVQELLSGKHLSARSPLL